MHFVNLSSASVYFDEYASACTWQYIFFIAIMYFIKLPCRTYLYQSTTSQIDEERVLLLSTGL